MALREYVRKRKFSATPEPAGQAKRGKPATGKLFVIQKHAARRLHYDLRFEAEGVLKSWAVPKGLPLQIGEKHLAIHVEDHPRDYAEFEGNIPAGNYGAGSVMVWDTGTYDVEGNDLAKALRQGRIHFTLHGKKLRGDWSLVRMRKQDEKDQWLVIKHGTSAKPFSARVEDSSAITRRSMKNIAAAHEEKQTELAGPPELAGADKEKPAFIVPMKALLVESPPRGGDWIYEIKFDGMRIIAVKNGRTVRLFSRNHHDVTEQFPAAVAAIAGLSVTRAVLDGEIVALDDAGRSSFQLLQPYMHARQAESTAPLFYYLFDLLHYEGRNLRALPVESRKDLLHSLLPKNDGVLRFSDHLEGSVAVLLRETKRLGLEGLIGKRRSSVYESDRRSGAWIKMKTVQEQEFVIGGYTQPRGSRSHFGALLLGYYEKGKLRFASKVGTGFNENLLKTLHGRFEKLRQTDSPFDQVPAGTRLSREPCIWLEPKLVAQVRFSEWTREGGLRQPVFLGLRTDKAAARVRREKAVKR